MTESEVINRYFKNNKYIYDDRIVIKNGKPYRHEYSCSGYSGCNRISWREFNDIIIGHNHYKSFIEHEDTVNNFEW